ncbi:YhdP family protein [Magnetococcales bacterium HHB-1]
MTQLRKFFSFIAQVVLRSVAIVMIVASFYALFAMAWLWRNPDDIDFIVSDSVAWFSKQVGLHIALGKTQWHPSHPLTLQLKQIRVVEKGHQNPLHIKHLWIKIAPLDFLANGRLISVHLSGVYLDLRRKEKTKFYLGHQSLDELAQRLGLLAEKSHQKKKRFKPSITVTTQNMTIDYRDWVIKTVTKKKKKSEQTKAQPPYQLRLQGWHALLTLDSDNALTVQLRADDQAIQRIDQSTTKDKKQPKKATTFFLSGSRSATRDWYFSSRIDHFTLTPLRPLLKTIDPLKDLTSPVSLMIEGQKPQQGDIRVSWQLQLEPGTFKWPSLFRYPFKVRHLKAEGKVFTKRKLWNVHVNKLFFRTGKGYARGGFQLNHLGGKVSPELDLNINAHDVPVNQAKLYYPTPIMHPGLVKWLDNHLKEGVAVKVNARIKGPVYAIPFKSRKQFPNAIFRFTGNIKNTSVRFFPKVEPIRDIDAHIDFNRLRFQAKVKDGRFSQSRKIRGRVEIRNLLKPVLTVDAKASADFQSIWKDLVLSKALGWGKSIGLEKSHMRGSGPAGFSLTLPLANLKKSRFQGKIDFKKAEAKLPFLPNPLTKLVGRFVIDEQNLSIQINQGHMMEIPWRGQIKGQSYSHKKKGLLNIDLSAHLPEPSLNRWLRPVLGEKGVVKGWLPIHMHLTKKATSPMIHFESRIKSRDVQLRGRWGWDLFPEEQAETVVKGRVNNRGEIYLSSANGRLGSLSFSGSGWLDVKKEPWYGSIKLKRFTLGRSKGSLEFARVAPKKRSAPEKWQITANLGRLDLFPTWASDKRADKKIAFGRRYWWKKQTKKQQSVNNTAWPWLDLSLKANEVLLANHKRGRKLNLHLSMRKKSLKVKHLSLKLGKKKQKQTIHGHFNWLGKKSGYGSYQSRFQLHTEDMGMLLEGLNWHRDFSGGEGKFLLNLKGAVPKSAKLSHHLSGHGELEIKNGVIERFRGVSQLLGFLSLAGIPKLLMGQRPDVAGEGFYYDTLSGKFRLKRSIISTKLLDLSGPSMRIVTAGALNFPKDRVNLQIGIRPFGTLDSILNILPIGKLVTGKRGAFVETLFVVTGSMDHPKAAMQPVSSLAPGILRDILNLPADLINTLSKEPKKKSPKKKP